MALQIRRGTQAEWEANNSNVVAGEPAIATDSGRFFVGTDNGDFAEFANVDNVLSNANGAVDTANLADGAVTTAKIADNSVTTAKLSGVIDNTLSVSGKAGDAKATGDAVAFIDNIIITYGDPQPEWAIGSLNSNGAPSNSYKNSIRSAPFACKKGGKISTNSGYWIRVYRYNSSTSAFINRTDWVTEYTETEGCNLRLLVSSTAYKNNNSAVLTDTSFKDEVIWSKFILSTIKDDVAPLISAYPTNASGGYLNITDQLVQNECVLTGSLNSTLTLDYTENIGYVCLKRECKVGDKFRITGAGNATSRLWAFTDSSKVVKSLSATFLTETDLVVTSPVNGYFIYNSNSTGTLVPKIEYFSKDIKSAYDITRYSEQYEYLNIGHDVLSAFSNIHCCGDSLTASVVYTGGNSSDGYVTRPAYKRYPNILADKTGATVEYHALGGYSAKDWWDNYNQYIAEKENQLAIIYLGTNGGLTDTLSTDASGSDVANYDKTTNTGCYASIVKSFLDVGAKVLLIHINKRDDNLNVTNDVISQVATKFGVAEVTVPYLSNPAYHYYPDLTGRNNLHYNDLGYSAFTESLIRQVGALNTDNLKLLIPT